MNDLTGKTAVVTGGGRGIGRASCLELARLGAAVVVCDILTDEADLVVEEIVSTGGRAVASYASVATAEGGQSVIDDALASFGGPDIIVNNAGFLRNAYFEDLAHRQLDEVLDVHLKGAFYVTQPAWKIMQSRGWGRVINMSSASALFSHQGLSNYAAAKSGLYGLTKALAFEGKRHGIQVNAVLPNPGLGATQIAYENPIPDMAENSDQSVRVVLQTRVSVQPTAAMVAYLASEECAVSGEAYSVHCGRFARVFVGVTEGWLAPSVDEVSTDDVAAHIERIRDQGTYIVPGDMFDENASVADLIRRGQPH